MRIVRTDARRKSNSVHFETLGWHEHGPAGPSIGFKLGSRFADDFLGEFASRGIHYTATLRIEPCADRDRVLMHWIGEENPQPVGVNNHAH